MADLTYPIATHDIPMYRKATHNFVFIVQDTEGDPFELTGDIILQIYKFGSEYPFISVPLVWDGTTSLQGSLPSEHSDLPPFDYSFHLWQITEHFQRPLFRGRVRVEDVHTYKQVTIGNTITIDNTTNIITIGNSDSLYQWVLQTVDGFDAHVETKKTELDGYVDDPLKIRLDDHTTLKEGELDTYTDTVKKPELDAYTTVKEGELDSHTNTKKTELNTHVDTVNKPELNTHTDLKKAELNTHGDTVNKPALDAYTTVKEGELDTHTTTKKTELDTHVTTVNKPDLDAYTTTKKGELDTHTTTKEGQLDTYTTTKEGELDTHTGLKKTELDTYVDTDSKPEIDTYVSGKITSDIDPEVAKAATWAEGEDAAVVVLGGEKSAKGWALQAAESSGDGLWEHDIEGESIKPILNKKVDASHLSGTIDGGALHP
jgi:hypothetical protein